MKVIKVLLFLIITLICFTGCLTSWPSAPYSFTENGNGTAEITFRNVNELIQLISIEGDALPLSERGKTWNPVSIPAERPLTLIVNLMYYYTPPKKKSSGHTGTILDIVFLPGAIADEAAQLFGIKEGWHNIDVIFNCPPLEVGGNYRLRYVGDYMIERGLQKPRLVLIDIRTENIIYEQDVEGKWQAGGKNWKDELQKVQSKKRE
jgi:hypothetical protein